MNRNWLGMLNPDGEEIASAGYVRQPLQLVTVSADLLLQANGNPIEFGPAGEAWGEVGSFGVFDSETAGEVVGLHEVEDLVILEGEGIRLEAGQFSIQLMIDGCGEECVADGDVVLN